MNRYFLIECIKLQEKQCIEKVNSQKVPTRTHANCSRVIWSMSIGEAACTYIYRT